MYFFTVTAFALPAFAGIISPLAYLVPPSPSCGPQSPNNATCESSPYGPCCSTSGFCMSLSAEDLVPRANGYQVAAMYHTVVLVTALADVCISTRTIHHFSPLISPTIRRKPC